MEMVSENKETVCFTWPRTISSFIKHDQNKYHPVTSLLPHFQMTEPQFLFSVAGNSRDQAANISGVLA